MITISSKMTANSFKEKVKKELDIDLEMAETIQDKKTIVFSTKPMDKSQVEVFTNVLEFELSEGNGIEEIEFQNQNLINGKRLVVVSHLKSPNKNLNKTSMDGLTPDEIIYAVTGYRGDRFKRFFVSDRDLETLSSIFERRNLKIDYDENGKYHVGKEIHYKDNGSYHSTEDAVSKNIYELDDDMRYSKPYEADRDNALSSENTPYLFIAGLHRMYHIPVEPGNYDTKDIARFVIKDALKDFGFNITNESDDKYINDCFKTLAKALNKQDSNEDMNIEIAHYIVANHHFTKMEDNYPTLRREDLVDHLIVESNLLKTLDFKRLDEMSNDLKKEFKIEHKTKNDLTIDM